MSLKVHLMYQCKAHMQCTKAALRWRNTNTNDNALRTSRQNVFRTECATVALQCVMRHARMIAYYSSLTIVSYKAAAVKKKA